MTTRSRTVGSPDATRAVDWEQRVDFPRLRQDRLDRAKAALEASDFGRAEPQVSATTRGRSPSDRTYTAAISSAAQSGSNSPRDRM